jgi:hypothetical protein
MGSEERRQRPGNFPGAAHVGVRFGPEAGSRPIPGQHGTEGDIHEPDPKSRRRCRHRRLAPRGRCRRRNAVYSGHGDGGHRQWHDRHPLGVERLVVLDHPLERCVDGRHVLGRVVLHDPVDHTVDRTIDRTVVGWRGNAGLHAHRRWDRAERRQPGGLGLSEAGVGNVPTPADER